MGGGGVLIAYRSDTILATELNENSNCEIKWVQIQATFNRSLILGTFYRPPNSPSNLLDELKSSLSNIYQLKNHNTPVYLCGDFNLKDIDWPSLSLKPRAIHSDSCNKLLDIISDFSLEQMVSVPTRGSAILDLILTNKPDTLINIKTGPGMSTVNDHDIISANILCQIPINRKSPRKIFLWKRGDIAGLQEATSKFTKQYLNDSKKNSVNQNCSCIISYLTFAKNKFIPSKLISGKYSYPWINKFLKKMIRKRRHLYIKLKNQSKCPRATIQYKHFQKTVNKLIEESYWNYTNNLFNNQASDTENKKNLFKFIKSQRKDHYGVSSLKHQGETIIDPQIKANLINDHFSSVFTKPCNSDIPTKGASPYKDLPKVTVTLNGIRKLLSGLQTKKATGPDNIPARLLKAISSEISPAIVNLFQQSLDSGVFPDAFKEANITPIHKKGPKSDVKNYRPISLTSVLGKCLEHIMSSQIMNHLESNDVLSTFQHGFRKRRSTVSQLLTTSNDLANYLNKKSQVDGIFLDFTKAFDRVSHTHLLYKLNYYGVRHNYLSWAKSFLLKRTQKVLIDGKFSKPSHVLSGVPQGTVLGPLFFLCFINDLPDTVSSNIRLFADDAFLYRQINSISDHHALQSDLNALNKWSEDWLMEFNSSKCFVLTTTLKTKPSKFTYILSGQPLEVVKSHPYLGVTFDNKHSWVPHINSTVAKATRSLNYLSRNLHNCSPHVKEFAYNLYVRPQLEYASSVWSPQTVTGKNKIEKIQARAGRFVTSRFKRTDSKTEILRSLNWSPLENRRNITDIIICHKILHNKLEVPTEHIFTPHTSNTRSNSQQFQNLVSYVDAYKNSYFPRTITNWNKLPEFITSIEGEERFKREATSYLQICY